MATLEELIHPSEKSFLTVISKEKDNKFLEGLSIKDPKEFRRYYVHLMTPEFEKSLKNGNGGYDENGPYIMCSYKGCDTKIRSPKQLFRSQGNNYDFNHFSENLKSLNDIGYFKKLAEDVNELKFKLELSFYKKVEYTAIIDV